MGNPGGRVTMAHSYNPLPKDCGVNKRVAPQDMAETGKVACKRLYRLVLNKRDLARHKGTEIVIHRRQMKAVQVRDIAGNVERQNLACAVLQYFVAIQPSVEHKTALRSPISLAQNVMLRPHLPNGYRQAENRFPFFR
jgi:uncharacterized membrane protein